MRATFPIAAYDDIADRYDGSRGGEERGRRFAAEISRLLVTGGPSIELGVGTGVVAAGLRALGHDVIGIDLSSGMLRFAAARLPGMVSLASITHLPFASGCAANCYAIWVLHMIEDLYDALGGIYRVLRPGGRLVTCSVNNGPADDPISRIVFRMQTSLMGEQETKRDVGEVLRAIAREVGFTEIDGQHLVEQSYELAPMAMATTIEARGFSSLKDVDDERWESIVRPAVAELRALPHAERPMVRNTVHELLAFEKPN